MKTHITLLRAVVILTIVLSISLVSCRKYDNDITNLNTKITNLNSQLSAATSSLDGKITAAQGSIATINNQITANKDAITAINNQISTLNNNFATVEQLNKVKTDLTATNTLLSSEVKRLEGLIAALQTKYDELDGAYKAGDLALATKIDESIASLYTKVTGDIKIALTPVKDDITSIKAKLTELESQISNGGNSTTELATKIDNLDTQMNAKIDQINKLLEAYLKRIEDLEIHSVDYERRISRLELLDPTTDAIDKMFSDLDIKLAASINNLKTELMTSITNGDAAVTTAYTNAINQLRNELTISINGVRTSYLQDIASAKTDITTAYMSAIDQLRNEMNANIGNTVTQLNAAIANGDANVTAAYTSAISSLQLSVAQNLTSAVDALRAELNNNITTAISQLQGQNAQDIADAITALRAEINQNITTSETNLTTAYTAAVDALRTELNANITTAKNDLTAAYTTAINDAVAAATTSILAQVDSNFNTWLTNTYQPAINNLQSQIDAINANLAIMVGGAGNNLTAITPIYSGTKLGGVDISATSFEVLVASTGSSDVNFGPAGNQITIKANSGIVNYSGTIYAMVNPINTSLSNISFSFSNSQGAEPVTVSSPQVVTGLLTKAGESGIISLNLAKKVDALSSGTTTTAAAIKNEFSSGGSSIAYSIKATNSVTNSIVSSDYAYSITPKDYSAGVGFLTAQLPILTYPSIATINMTYGQSLTVNPEYLPIEIPGVTTGAIAYKAYLALCSNFTGLTLLSGSALTTKLSELSAHGITGFNEIVNDPYSITISSTSGTKSAVTVYFKILYVDIAGKVSTPASTFVYTMDFSN